MKDSALIKLIFALLLALAAASGPRAHGQSATPAEESCMADYYINAMTLAGGRVYLGGHFEHIGEYTGGGAPFYLETGSLKGDFPRINGTVYCCVADGKGGWFVGGAFSKVGYAPRRNLAHILPGGGVDEAFLADANSSVSALALSGATLYAGGGFTSIGGLPRSMAAALDAATGAVNPTWSPEPDGGVGMLALVGDRLYLGGSFSMIGGKARNRVAAVNPETGAALDWDAKLEPSGSVRALAVTDTTIYLGGSFSCNAGGQVRSNLASFSAATGAITDWNPGVSAVVHCLALAGSTLYIGGNFTSVGAAPAATRNRLAAFDISSGSLLPWNPDASGSIRALVVARSAVYVGGVFESSGYYKDPSIGGARRNYLAAIDPATGVVTAWDPTANGYVYALAASDDLLYVGGAMRCANMQDRLGLAALDGRTGALTGWNPEFNEGAEIQQLAASSTTLYVQGSFTSVNGTARNGLAAFDLATGALTLWNPPLITSSTIKAETINTLAAAGGKIYIGGGFTRVGGEVRKYLVALDPVTGAVAGPDWTLNQGVGALAATSSTLYIGGYFTAIGGQQRNRGAALDLSTGAVTAWNPDADAQVMALATAGPTVYAGGHFTRIGGQARPYLAALDPATGAATTWSPATDNDVNYLALAGSTLFASGSFTQMNGVARKSLATLDGASGQLLPWYPGGGSVNTVVAKTDSAIHLGGGFTKLGNSACSYLAMFKLQPSPGRLILSASSLSYRQGTPYAVDVKRGGAPTTRTLTLINAGDLPLAFTGGDAATPGLAITGRCASHFKIHSAVPSTAAPLEAGASVTVTVLFAPATTDLAWGMDAMLEVRTDSPTTPELYVSLTGDAVPVRLSGFEAD